jgi:hypothetical protein
MRVTNAMPLGVHSLLPVGTVHSVQTLKASTHTDCNPNPNPNHQFCPNTEGLQPTPTATLTLTLAINSVQTLKARSPHRLQH